MMQVIGWARKQRSRTWIPGFTRDHEKQPRILPLAPLGVRMTAPGALRRIFQGRFFDSAEDGPLPARAIFPSPLRG